MDLSTGAMFWKSNLEIFGNSFSFAFNTFDNIFKGSALKPMELTFVCCSIPWGLVVTLERLITIRSVLEDLLNVTRIVYGSRLKAQMYRV